VPIPEKETTELYNLKKDVGETTNVAAQNSQLVSQMLKIMEQSRVPSPIFNFGKENSAGKD